VAQYEADISKYIIDDDDAESCVEANQTLRTKETKTMKAKQPDELIPLTNQITSQPTDSLVNIQILFSMTIIIFYI